ncbi:HEPN domain-containing protein [Pontibacter chinhatensis]|uniref:Uncharacterized protein n=1 Tax=Pontibacter chinhatensis TaxID=1436961 RepID=A0A1I2QSP8_9BACT|nr:HEPN domain-containing protein [Pontibacter chinhatensis]SFG28666.1 hypothetical protein SAMN05421739_10237 [Pontibacter chinhatensis]
MNITYLQSIQTSFTPDYILKKFEAKMPARDEYDRTHLRPSITLYYPREIEGYTYADYLTDVEQFYLRAGHEFSEELAQVYTFLFLSIYKVTGKARTAIDKLEKCFTKANLQMVFPMKVNYGEEKYLKLERFLFGKFKVQDVKKITKRNIPTTDYWERYIRYNKLNELVMEDFLAIQRDKQEVKVFNLLELYKYLPDGYRDFVFDVYFEALSELKWKHFWDEFSQDLADAVAFGMAFYDKRIFYEMGLGEGTQFTMYTHIAGNAQQGWMIPIRTAGHQIHYGWRHSIEHVNQAVEAYQGMKQKGESEFLHLHDVLISFATTAAIHLQDDRISDAFINLTAGLDAVLNSDTEEARSNTLKNRMAILTFKRLGVDIKHHYFTMSEMYKLRSEFVHAGKAIEREKVTELFKVVDQVNVALQQMHHLQLEGEDFTKKCWYADMDSLINDAHRRVPLDSKRLEEIGTLTITI